MSEWIIFGTGSSKLHSWEKNKHGVFLVYSCLASDFFFFLEYDGLLLRETNVIQSHQDLMQPFLKYNFNHHSFYRLENSRDWCVWNSQIIIGIWNTSLWLLMWPVPETLDLYLHNCFCIALLLHNWLMRWTAWIFWCTAAVPNNVHGKCWNSGKAVTAWYLKTPYYEEANHRR